MKINTKVTTRKDIVRALKSGDAISVRDNKFTVRYEYGEFFVYITKTTELVNTCKSLADAIRTARNYRIVF